MRRPIILVVGMTVMTAAILVAATFDRPIGLAAALTDAPGAPTPATATAMPYATYKNPTHGWSVEYPSSWRTRTWLAYDTAFTSYDPSTASFEQGLTFGSASAIVPPTEIRIHVEVLPNTLRLTVKQYVDTYLGQAPTQAHAAINSRSAGQAGGQVAEVVTVHEHTPLGQRNTVYVFFARPTSDRMYLVRALPAESVRRADFDRMLATLRIP